MEHGAWSMEHGAWSLEHVINRSIDSRLVPACLPAGFLILGIRRQAIN